MITSFTKKVVLDRMPTYVDRTLGIQAYGGDNLYPQRMWNVMRRSFTTKRAVRALSDFLYGDGFMDPLIGSMIVNRKGQTMNDILRLVANDVGLYDGFALHVNYNLNYMISEIKHVKFHYARMGVPLDDFGNIEDIKISSNWEQNFAKGANKVRVIYEYPIYNTSSAALEVQAAGGILNYPGQVFYFSPEELEYPFATFDTVMDQAQAQREIAVFDVSSIQNGFNAGAIFRYPGMFETEAKKEEFIAEMAEYFKGSNNANTTMVVEDPLGTAKQLLEQLNNTNLDKVHEGMSREARNAIRENYGQPMEVQGVAPESGMFNQSQIKEAYTYYNIDTETRRGDISRAFVKLMLNWGGLLPSGNFNIAPRTYGLKIPNQPAGPQGGTPPGGA